MANKALFEKVGELRLDVDKALGALDRAADKLDPTHARIADVLRSFRTRLLYELDIDAVLDALEEKATT